MFDLVLNYYFQYPTRKFRSSTGFWEIQELKYKISNLGIPVLFLGPRPYREEDVPECSGWEIFQIFPGKIQFPGNGIQERRPLISSRDHHAFLRPRLGWLTNPKDLEHLHLMMKKCLSQRRNCLSSFLLKTKLYPLFRLSQKS